MALLGRTTLLLALALALALPAACLYLWGRVRGPRAVQAACRLGLIVSCQLTALMFAGVAVNDYGSFYASWSELVGAGTNLTASSYHFGGVAEPGPAGPAAPVLRPAPRSRATKSGVAKSGVTESGVTKSGVTESGVAKAGVTESGVAKSGVTESEVTDRAAAVAPAPDPVDERGWTTLGWSAKRDWPDRGAVVTTALGGGGTNLAEEAYVYLPPAYFTDGAAGRTLPVVEVFTGYPGHPKSLVDKLHYPDVLLAAMRSGQAAPMILVMLRPTPVYPWDTECTDVPGGPQAFTYLAEDVPAAVSSKFGLRPSAYGAIGYSTGGYCAAKLAMMDPARFGAVAGLSAYCTPAADRTTRGIFAHRADLKNDNDLCWRLQHLPVPRVSLLLATSADEAGRDGYDTTQRWLALVTAPMSADEIVLRHGGHNFRAWRREIPDALAWLSRHLADPGGRPLESGRAASVSEAAAVGRRHPAGTGPV